MITRLTDVDFDLAKQVARNVGGPVPEKPRRSNSGRKSDGLSQSAFMPKEPTIISRRIAILVADGVDVVTVQWLKTSIKKEGAFPWIIAPHRGTIYGAEPTASKDESVHADHHFEGQRSTMFDAVIIPPGSHIKMPDSDGFASDGFASKGRVIHWVREAFGHLKTIGAIGNGPCSPPTLMSSSLSSSPGVSFLEKALQLPEIKLAPKGDSGGVFNHYGVVTTWSLTDRTGGLPLDHTFLSTLVSEVSRHRNWDRELACYTKRVAF